MVYDMHQAGAWNRPTGTNLLDSGSHFYNVYTTKDGKYMSVYVLCFVNRSCILFAEGLRALFSHLKNFIMACYSLITHVLWR